MFPYERIVQWLAGPVAILAGWLATQLVQHVNIFGTLGLGKSAVAHAIVTAVTFLVSAAVTYLAHHKWLDNLAKWWLNTNMIATDLGETVNTLPDKPQTAVTPDGPPPPTTPVPPPAT